jgi:ketosteroid isomerase-like protein
MENRPMTMHRVLLLSLSVLTASGCVRYFPGTEIPDNKDTQAIREVMEKYRSAVEAKDVGTIVALCSEQYRDDAGTIQTNDDLDYATLREVLPKRLSKVQNANLYMELKRIDVQRDAAVATYSYVWRYRIPAYSNKPESNSDIMQMTFKRVGQQWKITRGL